MVKRGRDGRDSLIVDEKPTVDVPSSDSVLSEVQQARGRLRSRWELASVLNFLHVFRSVIKGNLEFSAEQIEMGLIKPDGVLAKIHIALLKGIPPGSKNLDKPDAWVTVLCKKIDKWWQWVAEGDFPLVANHGAEITRYKEFDPEIRLVILKALCEVRAEQDDIPAYIEETLKSGASVSTFRKDKIGGSVKGTIYWYEGDPIIGYRLYRERHLVNSQHRSKGCGRFAKPMVEFLWETLATDVEEFKRIPLRFSDSANVDELAVRNIIESEIMPALEKQQKNKERRLKRQQRETLFSSLLCAENGMRRSCRDRRPVIYTYDEYDRFINEAIRMDKKLVKGSGSENSREFAENNVTSVDDSSHANSSGTTNNKDDYLDDDDENKNDYADDYDDSDQSFGTCIGDPANSEHSRPAVKKKHGNVIDVQGLRRSTRNSCNTDHVSCNSFDVENLGNMERKKKPKQAPNPDAEYELHVIPDSEDEEALERDQTKIHIAATRLPFPSSSPIAAKG